jgi:hypothetical protein
MNKERRKQITEAAGGGAMKRWVVDLTAGKVELAFNQTPQYVATEYVSRSRKSVFVLAVDEPGAFVRAKQLLTKKEQDQ